MKRLLLLVMILVLWSLPAPVQGGSNNVDLDGKGLSHQSPAARENLKAGQQAADSVKVDAGRKAMADLQTKQRQNQADMEKAWEGMNKGSNLENPWKEPPAASSPSAKSQTEAAPVSSQPAKNLNAGKGTGKHQSLNSKVLSGGGKQGSHKTGKSRQAKQR